MEPIFSYAFKDAVSETSTTAEFREFFAQIFASDDAFMRQLDKVEAHQYPRFDKHQRPGTLVFKTTRYHDLLSAMLSAVPELKLVSIVRNPCAVINSWLRTSSEFPEGADPMIEWRTGSCRNDRPEEFWGFNDWKYVTLLHHSLWDEYPDRFKIIRYETLLGRPIEVTQDLFTFCDLELTKESMEFIDDSNARHDDRPYAVFKSKSVADRWKKELPGWIADEIHADLAGTELECYLTPANDLLNAGEIVQ